MSRPIHLIVILLLLYTKPLRNLIRTESVFNQPDMISVFCITVMFLTVDLYRVFHTRCREMFRVCLITKFHMPNRNG